MPVNPTRNQRLEGKSDSQVLTIFCCCCKGCFGLRTIYARLAFQSLAGYMLFYFCMPAASFAHLLIEARTTFFRAVEDLVAVNFAVALARA